MGAADSALCKVSKRLGELKREYEGMHAPPVDVALSKEGSWGKVSL